MDNSVRLVQLAKALTPKVDTLSRLVMEVRLLQPEKALLPMVFIYSGRVIVVRLLQSAKALSEILVSPVKYDNSLKVVI